VKKVIYNTCYGGFSISRECAEFMADHGNEECIDTLDRPPKSPKPFFPEDELFWGALFETPRHDAILVMAVEHLGLEAASGEGATLDIHLLRGDRYFIDQYDGSETVVEPDDIEWVVV